MTDIFTSTPATGAIVNDWTKETLTVDIINAIGEKFHFEIKPNEKDSLKARPTDSPADKHGKTYVNIHLPILRHSR